MKKISWMLQTAVFYIVTWIVAYLPLFISDSFGRLVGLGIYWLIPFRRKIAIDNIRQALPAMTASPLWNYHTTDPQKIARQVYVNIGRSLSETCRLYHGRGDDLFKSIEVQGQEHYLKALERGKGVVMLTGHCGNWELGALAYGRVLNTPIYVVARRQNNPYLNALVEKMRLHYDNRIIYKDNALRNMISAIRKKGVIGLLLDQAGFPHDCSKISFLGRMAWASRAPVLLARKTGATVLPCFIHREGNRHVITINPECTFSDDTTDEGVARDVKHYSEYIERFIIQHPADWYWVHRRWKRAGEIADAA